jgi:hypothetical protein
VEFGLRDCRHKRTARKACTAAGYSSSSSSSRDEDDERRLRRACQTHNPKPVTVRQMSSSSNVSDDERFSSRPPARHVPAAASGRDPDVVESHGTVLDDVGGDGLESSSSSKSSSESFSRAQCGAEGAGGKAAAKPKKVTVTVVAVCVFVLVVGALAVTFLSVSSGLFVDNFHIFLHYPFDPQIALRHLSDDEPEGRFLLAHHHHVSLCISFSTSHLKQDIQPTAILHT